MTATAPATRREATGSAVLASRPVLVPDAIVAAFGTSALLWAPGRAPRSVPLVTAAVAPHLDGRTSLAELAGDLAAVLGAPVTEVEDDLIHLAVDLALDGSLDGMDEAIARLRPQVPGSPIVTEHPDGTRTVTYSTVLSTSSSTDPAPRQIVVDGGPFRSPAELVPADTCLGAKLRAGEPATRLHLLLDGLPVAVQTDDPAVAEAITATGVALTDEHAPVVAFVVRPYEGSGPWRVYDALGARRGRPRTVDQVLAVIDEIVGEVVTTPTTRLTLTGQLVTDGTSAVVVPPTFVDGTGVRRAIERAGLQVVPGRRLVYESGRLHGDPRLPFLAPPAPSGPLVPAGAVVLEAEADGDRPDPSATAAQVLLDGLEPEDAATRLALVREVRDLLSRGPVSTIPRTGAVTAEDAAATVAQVLGATAHR